MSSDCPVMTSPIAPAIDKAMPTGNASASSTQSTTTIRPKLSMRRTAVAQQREHTDERARREQRHADRQQQLRYPHRHGEKRRRAATEAQGLLHHLPAAPCGDACEHRNAQQRHDLEPPPRTYGKVL